VGRFPGQFLRRTELIKRSLRLDDKPKWWCQEPLQVPDPAVRSKTPHVVTIAIVEWRSPAHESTQIRLKRVGWVRKSRELVSTFSKSTFYAEGRP